jgi:ATP-dependent Lon protease
VAEIDEETQIHLAEGQESVEIPTILPVLPVRDVVVFPGVTVPLAVGREKSLAALEEASQSNFLIVASQRDPATEDPGFDDLYPVGCVVRVVRIIDARSHGKQAVVVGVVRTRLSPPVANSPALRMRLDLIEDVDPDPNVTDAVWKKVVALAHRVIDLHDDYPDEWKNFVSGIPGAGLLADVVASTLPLPPEEKALLLAEANPTQRLERVADHLEREVTIAETQRALNQTSDSDDMEPGRRERLLRRRMRELEKELGEADPSIREAEELRERIDEANLPKDAREQAER